MLRKEAFFVLKKRPFFVASIAFGSICLLLLLVASLSFLSNDATICTMITKLFHMKSGSFTNATIAEISAVCAIPSFIFALKACYDEEIE